MQKRLITFIVLFICFFISNAEHLFAQNCKFKEEKDPFSNEVFKSAEYKIGPLTWNWILYLKQKNNNIEVSLNAESSGVSNTIISAGDTLYIRLENNEIIHLVSSQNVNPNIFTKWSTGTIWTKYLIQFEINDQLIRKLATSNITDMKININGNDLTLPKITKKQTTPIQKAFECLAQK